MLPRHAEALGDGGLSEGYGTLTWLTDGKLIIERTEIKERREKRDAGVRYVGRNFFFLPSRECCKSGEGHVSCN